MINRRVRRILAKRITIEIHWVPQHSTIPRHVEADHQANLARDGRESTVLVRPNNSCSNRARRVSERRSATNAEWEGNTCSEHFSYILKGTAGTKRPIPMTSVKSLPTMFSQLKSGHEPTGVYLKRFGHRDDDKWWCAGTVSQMREPLFRHCYRLKLQQMSLWKTV